MRLLTEENCRECGGRVRIGISSLTCLSCGWDSGPLTKQQMAKAIEKCEEYNPEVALTATGVWSTKHDLHSWLDLRRLAQNLIQGYELRAQDKLLLLEAGFASRIVEIEPQKED